MKMLLKRHRADSHEEVELFVNWDNVSLDDIKLMASHYIHSRVSHDLKSYETKLPEAVTVYAGDYIHNEVIVEKPIVVPKSWKEAPKSKARKELEALFEDLTPAERAALLA